MSAVKAVLLDIEGTVSSISFVRDVLFPYTLQALPQVLDEKWDTPEFAPYRNEFPTEFRDEREKLEAHVRDLTARDVKVAYLKGLQGYLWLTAYRSGNIKAPLYADVIRALPLWTSRGLKVYIYSSGSVLAQKLFFKYTDNEAQPDQQGYLSGYFDTVNAGVKWEKGSYEKICEETGILPSEWVFLTDNVRGMWSLLCCSFILFLLLFFIIASLILCICRYWGFWGPFCCFFELRFWGSGISVTPFGTFRLVDGGYHFAGVTF
ncbi:enolase-phosphatase E1 [Orbilia blumenaviensis]|uniref:Enolase-phosphatase E1 n=1 Tax=Orbilia blumenaviensis TaxID=1796055 RepID=A0AAV9UI74_9PEZI